jgi:DNA-binding CsgD family transcriptional regulator
MTAKEFAIRIYCLTFIVEDDGGDAHVQGILDIINALPERERIALEGRYRYGKPYREIAADLGGIHPNGAAWYVNRARLKLRHSSRYRKMSIRRIEQDRVDMERIVNATAAADDPKLLCEIGFSTRVFTALLRNDLQSVESILEIPTYERLLSIRYLGSRGCHEVIEKMRQSGYGAWADRMLPI